MFAKLTSKNQLTLPKDVVKDFPGTEYFDVARVDAIVTGDRDLLALAGESKIQIIRPAELAHLTGARS
jgi:predicted nucleic acid-binding protein